MLRNLSFIALLTVVAMPAMADVNMIASSAYVQEYYREYCKNPMLSMPEGSDKGVASQRFIYSLIDRWNDNQTKYAASLTDERIASVDYLPATRDMLTDSYYCCAADNVFVNPNTGVCQACGDWVRASQLQGDCGVADGYYRSGGNCVKCTEEYDCAKGTAGRMLKLFCADDGWAIFGGGCVSCKDGYLCPKDVEMPQWCGAGNWCADNVATPCTATTLPDGTPVSAEQRCSIKNLWFEPDAKYIPCENKLTFTHTTINTCTEPGRYKKGAECVDCAAGDGYECAEGTSGRSLKLFCADGGEAFFEKNCESCRDGFMCPSGAELPEYCEAGFYCTGGVKTPCPGITDADGKQIATPEQQCPFDDMWYAPETAVCKDTGTVAPETSETASACLVEGKYRSNGKCVNCPAGYTCPEGTNGRMLAVFCSVSGSALFEGGCQQCWDGFLCPDTSEYPEYCGAGFYCTGGEKTPCPGGTTQCPFDDMWYAPETNVCKDTGTVAKETSETASACLIEGKYRSNGKCVNCPAGYTCPEGTNGRMYNIFE